MVERIIYLLGEGATEAEFTHQRKVWFTGADPKLSWFCE
jgi:hypothetical protein